VFSVFLKLLQSFTNLKKFINFVYDRRFWEQKRAFYIILKKKRDSCRT